MVRGGDGGGVEGDEIIFEGALIATYYALVSLKIAQSPYLLIIMTMINHIG